jgi:hypothetical protein
MIYVFAVLFWLARHHPSVPTRESLPAKFFASRCTGGGGNLEARLLISGKFRKLMLSKVVGAGGYMDRSPDPWEPPLEYWADTLSEALDHRETEKESWRERFGWKGWGWVRESSQAHDACSGRLADKSSAIDVASLLIGAGIGTMLANFGRDIAIEYFRQVVDDLNALPQPGDAPRVK